MFLINKQLEEIASGKQKVGENRSKYEPERKHKIGIIKPKSLTKLKQALEKKMKILYLKASKSSTKPKVETLKYQMVDKKTKE